MVSFEFNPKDLERAVKEAARDGLESIRQDYQGLFERLARQYKGRPVAEIESVLAAEIRQRGGNLPPAELTDYAQLITEGRHVEFRLEDGF